MQKLLAIDVAGRDLLRLEQAARDMGLTPEQLLQLGAEAAAQPLFRLPRPAPAKVLTFRSASTTAKAEEGALTDA